MSNYTYLEELEREAKKGRLYWLMLFVMVLLTIFVALVIIKKETEFFVEVQEIKSKNLTDTEKREIENRLSDGWVKRDLDILGKGEIESKFTNSDQSDLSESQKKEIEDKLN